MQELNDMSAKKEKPMTPEDILKLEIAQELGLDEKVKKKGWKSLTSKESGKIGGIMSARMKNNN